MDQIQRERKVDLQKFPREDADRILGELSLQVANLSKTTQDQINTLLKIYGFRAEVVVNFYEMNAQPKQEVKKSKRGRPKKA